MSDPDTLYPIRIDPTIEVNYDNSGSGAIQDVTITSSASSSYTSGSIYVGKRASGNKSRILMKFPGIDFDDYGYCDILSADVMMRDLMCESEELEISTHTYEGAAWNQTTVSWDSTFPHQLGYRNDMVWVSYSNGMQLSPQHRYAFSFDLSVNMWQAGEVDQDKGIIFIADHTVEQGTTTFFKTFASFNRSSYKPYVVVSYRESTPVTPPSGWIDGFNDSFIRGWAWNSSTPNSPVTVKITFSNDTTGQVWEYTQLANIYRPDVAEAGYGTGNYGYLMPLDWSTYTPGTYTVRVKALNLDGVTYTELSGSPKTRTVEYYGQPLDDGDYYLNNKEYGKYLSGKITNDSQNPAVYAKSGLLSEFNGSESTSAKNAWSLKKHNNGYYLYVYGSSTEKWYLSSGGTYGSLRPLIYKTAADSTAALPLDCLWDIITVDGGMVLRSRHNGKFLNIGNSNAYNSDGEYLYLSDSLGTVGTSTYKSHVWRTVDLYAITGKELGSDFTIKTCTMFSGKTQPARISIDLPNAIWSTMDDFYFSGYNADYVSYNDETHNFTAANISNHYIVAATGTHKVTGISKAFSIVINPRASLVGVGEEHTSTLLHISDELLSEGYTIANTHTGELNTTVIDNLLDDDSYSVFVSISHGIDIIRNGYQVGTAIILNDLNSENLIEYTSNGSISNLELSNMKLVLFVGCKTGKGGLNALNLPSMAVSMGAESAIGFEGNIANTYAYLWVENLFDLLKDGYTLAEACDSIDETGNYDDPNYFSDYYIFGNSSIKIAD